MSRHSINIFQKDDEKIAKFSLHSWTKIIFILTFFILFMTMESTFSSNLDRLNSSYSDKATKCLNDFIVDECWT